jgi:hypothetical protein
MKTLLNILFSILLLTLLSCNNGEQSKHNPVKDPTAIEEENAGITINYDSTKVIKTAYVTDRKGVDIKQQANKNSKTLGTYGYGTKLEVIEETEDWFGVRDRITREFYRDGCKIESTTWEKVYVVKNKTGSIEEIKLIPSDLNIISSLTINQKTEYFETDKKLTKYLTLELIDKSLFDNQKNSAVCFLLTDTIVKKKRNGILELKCKNKTVKYVDKPDAEVDVQVFNYVGQIEFLNKYPISGAYWESGDYKFIDKTSGEETNTFVDYPYISPDKKSIICINTNHFNFTADLEFYTISGNEIKQIMSASFKNWMPTLSNGKMFWSSDGYLYLTVNHVNSFWKTDGNLNDKCQHIRIKIL